MWFVNQDQTKNSKLYLVIELLSENIYILYYLLKHSKCSNWQNYFHSLILNRLTMHEVSSKHDSRDTWQRHGCLIWRILNTSSSCVLLYPIHICFLVLPLVVPACQNVYLTRNICRLLLHKGDDALISICHYYHYH